MEIDKIPANGRIMEAMGSKDAKTRTPLPSSEHPVSLLRPRLVAENPAAHTSKEALADRGRASAQLQVIAPGPADRTLKEREQRDLEARPELQTDASPTPSRRSSSV